MAERMYVRQTGDGDQAKFERVTVRSPRPGQKVTLHGVVPEGDSVGHDLGNIPVMFGDRSVTVPADFIDECVSVEDAPAPKRTDEAESRGRGRTIPPQS